MTLGQKQKKFTHMVGRLIIFAYELGYEITFGDAYRDPRVEHGLTNSLHRSRLAIDLNLFKDGEYLTSTEAHQPLGEWWERQGGSWGGRFDDGNHYSLAHDGRR